MTGSVDAATVSTTSPSVRCLARLRPAAAAARLQLFCFPHVGAGAATFKRWLGDLPAEVDLYAVRPPGRESRMREPLYTDARALLDEVERHVAPLLDPSLPFVVVGHCSGSVLAYEFARRLCAADGPRPRLLVLSSAEGPRTRRIEEPPLHRLSREDLLARVVEYGGMAEQVLEDPELMAIFERILRADYQVVETVEYSAGLPLDVPITVLGGRRDRFVSCSSMASWSFETAKEFSLHVVEADHYILDEMGPLIGRMARCELARGGEA
jgi:medium-chain acyl-[acyl-carrier-protein] hydrolase